MTRLNFLFLYQRCLQITADAAHCSGTLDSQHRFQAAETLVKKALLQILQKYKRQNAAFSFIVSELRSVFVQFGFMSGCMLNEELQIILSSN